MEADLFLTLSLSALSFSERSSMLVIPSKSTTQKKSDAFPPFFSHFFHVGGNGIVLEKFHIHSFPVQKKEKSGNPSVDAAAIFFAPNLLCTTAS